MKKHSIEYYQKKNAARARTRPNTIPYAITHTPYEALTVSARSINQMIDRAVLNLVENDRTRSTYWDEAVQRGLVGQFTGFDYYNPIPRPRKKRTKKKTKVKKVIKKAKKSK